MRTTILAACFVLLASAATAATSPEISSFLDDPEWKKRFLGSYGFLSGAEPQVKDTELELLREVIGLMKANPKAAESVLAQQITGDSSAALDFVLANLSFQNGQLDSAAKHYSSAIDKFPDFRRAHKNLGLLRVQKGDFKGGAAHLGRAVELGDRDGRNYGLLGYCYINLEKNLAAKEAYSNAILQEPDTRDWQLGLARALLATNQHREAVALFQSLIEDDPSDVSAWMLQANAYIGLEQPMDAATNLEAVRMMGKTETSSLVLLGDIYMNAGMYDLAKNAYLDVIRSDKSGGQFTTAYRAAELLIRTRSFDSAKEILNSVDARYAKELSQEDELKVLTLKAKVARAEGREKEAAKLLESIVDRDGTRGEALLELASYYHGRGQEERAILLVERARKLDDFEYRALLEHAQFAVTGRDYAKAAELLRDALAIKREPRVERFLARVEGAVRPR